MAMCRLLLSTLDAGYVHGKLERQRVDHATADWDLGVGCSEGMAAMSLRKLYAFMAVELMMSSC